MWCHFLRRIVLPLVTRPPDSYNHSFYLLDQGEIFGCVESVFRHPKTPSFSLHCFQFLDYTIQWLCLGCCLCSLCIFIFTKRTSICNIWVISLMEFYVTDSFATVVIYIRIVRFIAHQSQRTFILLIIHVVVRPYISLFIVPDFFAFVWEIYALWLDGRMKWSFFNLAANGLHWCGRHQIRRLSIVDAGPGTTGSYSFYQMEGGRLRRSPGKLMLMLTVI